MHHATGILMQRFGIDGLRALALLMTVSDRSGVSAERLATRVIATAGHNSRRPKSVRRDLAQRSSSDELLDSELPG
jgi:hypothetical protein